MKIKGQLSSIAPAFLLSLVLAPSTPAVYICMIFNIVINGFSEIRLSIPTKQCRITHISIKQLNIAVFSTLLIAKSL